MPPVDSSAPTLTPEPTPTPEQAPVPEPPKKQSFWSKLFGGKKAAAPAVPENHESQTPPPQLDDATERNMIPPTESAADNQAAPVEPTAQPTFGGAPAAPAPTQPQQDAAVPTMPMSPPQSSEENETTPPAAPTQPL